MLSLIVASRNEGLDLQRTLDAALAIQPPSGGLEISVVDDGSSDGSTACLDHGVWLERRQRGELRLRRHQKAQGVSRARHRGAVGCRGDVLVFIDAHLGFPQTDLWQKVEQHFQDNGSDLLAIDCCDLATGASNAGHVYTSKRLCHQAISWVRRSSEPLVNQPVPFVNGGFFAITRDCYVALGGFPLFLQGWGHEDRFLSMLAYYRGFRTLLRQDLKVTHRYRTTTRQHPSGVELSDYADPLPAEGIPADLQAEFEFANRDLDEVALPRLLMNSLRCGSLLYSPAVFDQLCEQLRADYGQVRLDRGLAVLAQERPQLDHHLRAAGLTPAQRDTAMEAFFGEFSAELPMLIEAQLQALRHFPAAAALSAIASLPKQLASLQEPDASHYAVARLFLEGSFAHAVADWPLAIRCQLEALSHVPDYLPALRMLTLALRQQGRTAALRFWLEHAAAVVDRYRPQTGPDPVGAWHPACTNGYMRHQYWPAVDREIWQELAWLEQAEGQSAAAAGWLVRLLEQTPGDAALLQQLQSLYPIQPCS